MFQKIVLSALVVMMSTAAFAIEEAHDGRDARDQARDNVAAQGRADAQNKAVGDDYLGLIANDQAKSQSAGGATASKVLTDAKLSQLPGVRQMAVDLGTFRNTKVKDPVTGQEREMTQDEALVAALGKVRPGLTEKEFVEACGQ